MGPTLPPRGNLLNSVREFLRLESASGILIVGAAILALVLSNSPLSHLYDALLNLTLEIRVGTLGIAKPLLLWINDGLMAVFFLLVGLEVKREALEGRLSDLSQVVLPLLAAAGGMIVPAVVYVAINWGNPMALKGWAIPTATDIAFALAVLSLLGPRIPISLKLFLLTLAIADDLGAILIIAVYYSADLSHLSLTLAAFAFVTLVSLNLLKVNRVAAYVVAGVVLWVFVLKSGVHATLAGVVLAFAVPLRPADASGQSPLRSLETSLHPWIAFAVLPIFAFANAGISLDGLEVDTLLEPIPLGTALGLFVGKQVGVFGFSWLTIKAGLAKLPNQASWLGLYGTSILCGIGFTMSLFISSLAFEQGGFTEFAADRLGILVGSVLSAIAGYLVLRYGVAISRQADN